MKKSHKLKQNASISFRFLIVGVRKFTLLLNIFVSVQLKMREQFEFTTKTVSTYYTFAHEWKQDQDYIVKLLRSFILCIAIKLLVRSDDIFIKRIDSRFSEARYNVSCVKASKYTAIRKQQHLNIGINKPIDQPKCLHIHKSIS